MGEALKTHITPAQPPIKWPGGKSSEFQYIQHLIPSFDRYIEPFFGGGAVFFKLRPEQAVINDFSKDLMNFYRFLKGELDRKAFRDELYNYVVNWEKIPQYISLFDDQFIELYQDYKSGLLALAEIKKTVAGHIQKRENEFNGLFDIAFCLDQENLVNRITDNLTSKVARTKEVETMRGDISARDLTKNIETAFRSGFYMHFRDVMNGQVKGSDRVSLAKKTANFYFIREFCYGAMFRYNASGHFNIPYGGIAYNSKDFRKKVDSILSEDFRELFDTTVIEDGDFEDIFKKYKPGSNDFIFLDPPYDSDFSDYDDQAFGEDDHRRLARQLHATKAKFILLIKETEFISSLYTGSKQITIESFDKKYLYNVKGRNNQETTHLIIYNY